MTFKKDLIIGLSKKNKRIPSKYHYDLQGSKYFEKITKQKEYYPTRKEKEILKKISKEIPKLFKGKLSYVELGSGAIDKIKLLINKDFEQAKPNSGHMAVASLFQQGKLLSVITQNVDGLHQASGIPDEHIVELHGNSTYAACLDCKKHYDLQPILESFERDGETPVCDECRGIVKTATISFGQTMPVDAMKKAEEQTIACDLFMVLGSSLVVYPAAGFPRLAKQVGASLAIVNREPTDLDEIADLVIHDEIGTVLGEL